MDAPADLEINLADITILGRCRKVKAWFHDHGLDDEFKTLVKGGAIKASIVLATGDPRAEQVVRRKLGEAANG
jgi:hypothetical protein